MTTSKSNNPSETAPAFITRQELSVRWKCSLSSIKRREKHGLKPTRLGPRMVRYSLKVIEELEQESLG